jgi:hypothetical protein
MKNYIKFALLTLFVISLSGCAMHTGYMNNSAALSTANFSYTKQHLQGYSDTWYVLGIGGLEKEALVEEAKRDMMKDYELKPNQALANVTVNWKNSFFIVVSSTKCTVTADIVEFK